MIAGHTYDSTSFVLAHLSRPAWMRVWSAPEPEIDWSRSSVSMTPVVADAGGVSELSFRSSASGMAGMSSGSGMAHVSFGSSVSSS